MNAVFETKSGKIVNADNIDWMKTVEDNSIDSCISDFPYAIDFMGKSWDSSKNFYDWCKQRSDELIRIMKPGSYTAIFGSPKTNHRMKSAFEDSGFKIVDEIDWLYMCISDDTDILTQRGWVGIDDISENDFVMTLNTASDLLEWNKVDMIHKYDYKGKMCSIKTVNTDQLITPNHRILYKYKYKKMKNNKIYYNVSDYVYTKADELHPKMGINLPLASRYLGSKNIGCDLAYLIGFILGDGSICKDRSICIYQTSAKPENVYKVRSVLKSLNIKYRERSRILKYSSKITSLSKIMKEEYVNNYIMKHADNEYVEYTFYICASASSLIFEIIDKIDFPDDFLEWCYADRLQLFYGLIDSDGSITVTDNGAKYFNFWQKSSQFREKFQLLCFSLGFRTSWNDKKYCVGVSTKSTTQIQSKYFVSYSGKKSLPTVDYSGRVWCVSTKNTNFVARRNKKIFITGNSGMPSNQDIGKMYDRNSGAKRETILDIRGRSNKTSNECIYGKTGFNKDYVLSKPTTEQAKKWDDWKTAGLKPAHETITIFQKPLEGTYIENIEKYGVGGMNIGACRVPISKEDIDMLNAKASKNPTTNYSDKEDKVYGAYAADMAMPANLGGRFPPNIVLSDNITDEVDKQTGITKSAGGSGDSGGGSRLFPIFKYCPKVSPSERLLPNGKRNPHVTLKPIDLIKWIIKLITPKDGLTIDITAGSCTHAVACEQLNRKDGYNLRYVDVELCNSEENPYCEVGKQRLEEACKIIKKNKLF